LKSFVLLAAILAAAPALAQEKADPLVKRGRYVALIGGCNDCHTPMYPQSGGKVAEAQWLTGDPLGWHGPWGTTYATNLRLYMQELTEEQWVKKAKTLSTRPPMPWFNVREMTTGDLRALYRYIRHLGPAGKPAPAYLPPDKTPSEPVVRFPGAQK
jgi:mono/diheme cytochrome c family protein